MYTQTRNIIDFMKNKKVKNVLLRYSLKYNLWANRKGTHVYREYKNSNYNRFLQIHQRADGSKFLSLTTPGIVELDELVADCYNPKPRDGNTYELVHKDGDLRNCNASNLLWNVVKFDPQSTKRKLNNGITVTCDGKFYDGKKELLIVKEIGDADTDRIVGINPLVCYYRKDTYNREVRKDANPDDLMAIAGFVNGDKSLLKNPKVLHKDHDYLNFSEDNLEWVEESSQEYQEYKNKKKNDIAELTKRLNPNKPFIGGSN